MIIKNEEIRDFLGLDDMRCWIMIPIIITVVFAVVVFGLRIFGII